MPGRYPRVSGCAGLMGTFIELDALWCIQTGLPSTTLIIVVVGVMDFSSKPDALSRDPNSASVRSWPPGKVSIVMSKSFEMEGALPVGTTQSTISSLPFAGITLRQWLRIWTDCSSVQCHGHPHDGSFLVIA